MRDAKTHSLNKPRTLDANPKASKQSSISEILQQSRSRLPLINAPGSALQLTTVQCEVDGLKIPGLRSEKRDSEHLLTDLWKRFREEAARILIEKEANSPQVIAFANVVQEVIDKQLPQLLGGLPFDNVGVAIRFAQNLILEHLHMNPTMAVQKDVFEGVAGFLESAIKSFPVSDTFGKDVELETNEQDENMTVSDRKYNEALIHVKKPTYCSSFNENIVKERIAYDDQQKTYLAELLFKIPLVQQGVADKADENEKKEELKKWYESHRNKGKPAPNYSKSVAYFVVELVANLDLKCAAEVLSLLTVTPVTDPLKAYWLSQLLREKIPQYFPETPSDTSSGTYAETFIRLGLLSEDLKEGFRTGFPPEIASDSESDQFPKSPGKQDALDCIREMSTDFGGKETEDKKTDEEAATTDLDKPWDEFAGLLIDISESDQLPKLPEQQDALDYVREMSTNFVKKETEYKKEEKKAATTALNKRINEFEALLKTLNTPTSHLDILAKSIGVILKTENLKESGQVLDAQLFCTAISLTEKGESNLAILEAFDNLLVHCQIVPGAKQREAFVEQLRVYGLLGGVDPRLLSHGVRSMASLIDEATKSGWATREEINVCMEQLGRIAFTGILGSHISRRKYGPLRAIIEQVMHHREVALLAPPMTNTSLALDTNMIDILLPAIKDVPSDMQYRRQQLGKLIRSKGITDIRLTNMNIAELSDYGRLIGRTIEIEIQCEVGQSVRHKLTFQGVPYVRRRTNAVYQNLFRGLESKKVGENKGHADRSMMADLFLAERVEGHEPTFATADLGIGEEIGTEEDQFHPQDFGAHKLHIETIETIKGEKGKRKQSPPGKAQSDLPEIQVKQPGEQGKGHRIYGFIVNGTHTVGEIAEIITNKKYGETSYQVYVVGGAVRDYFRNEKIHDVDLKTNMPVETLTQVLEQHKLPYHVTIKDSLFLVTVSKDPHALDIVCSVKTQKEFIYSCRCSKEKLDLLEDARERDFTLNALYLDASKGFDSSQTEKNIEDPLKAGGVKDARAGRLRLVADRDKHLDDRGSEAWRAVSVRKRAERVVEHLIKHPEEFGRTLKFIERTSTVHSTKPKEPNAPGDYHLDAEVLDILRDNAVLFLTPLVEEIKGEPETMQDEDVRKGSNPVARKNYFLHKTGFKTPMELVRVMQRLQFPAAVIQMIIPDTIAGEFSMSEPAYERNISPRNRPTGSPAEWDPSAAPKVKVDMTTGRLYQHRIYACLPDEVEGEQHTRILIDVDFTNHSIPGHPAPHHHLFRNLGGQWVKNETGFSNTGQPGRPDVRFKAGVYVYYGPTPWKWRPERVEGENFRTVLEKTCNAAGLNLERHDDDTVTIGEQLRISLTRLQQIDRQDGAKDGNKYRLTRLMMLISTLKQGAVGQDDDSLRYFTQSKRNGERLRFNYQLNRVDDFLVKHCKFDPKDPEISKLTHEQRIRLYDLITAGHDELASSAAAKYAMRQLKGVFSPFDFVEYFEFYIAAVAHRVSDTDVALLNQRMINHSSSILWSATGHILGLDTGADDEAIVRVLKANASKLRFTEGKAAAYHLSKHIEVSKIDPATFKTNQGIKNASKAYIKKIQDTILNGKSEKVVYESKSVRVFFFQSDGVTAIVEARLNEQWNARILSCYGNDDNRSVEIDVSFIEPSSSFSEKKGSPSSTFVEYIYRNNFGVFKRLAIYGDGNCFFHAVHQSAALKQTVGELRTIAAQAINPSNPADQAWLSPFLTGDGTSEQKLRHFQGQIQQDFFWAGNAGDFIPHMMARALHRPIYILSAFTGRLITIVGAGANPIYIFYNGVNHYEASERV